MEIVRVKTKRQTAVDVSNKQSCCSPSLPWAGAHPGSSLRALDVWKQEHENEFGILVAFDHDGGEHYGCTAESR